MIRRISFTIAVTVLPAVLAMGCAATHRGTTEVKWEKNETQNRVNPALHSGSSQRLATGAGDEFCVRIVADLRRRGQRRSCAATNREESKRPFRNNT